MELTKRLIDYKGKPYLPVVWRVIEFRQSYPLHAIETSVTVGQNSVLSMAKIVSQDGKVLATGHKSKSLKENDAIAKAETGAIGRALSFFGIGTELATQDLEEGDEIVDQAVARQATTTTTSTTTPATKALNDAIKGIPNAFNPAGVATTSDGYKTQYDKTGGVKLASAAQIKRLWAISIEKNMSPSDVNRTLAERYGFSDPKNLNWKQYKEFTEWLESQETLAEEPPMPTEMPADDLPF